MVKETSYFNFVFLQISFLYNVLFFTKFYPRNFQELFRGGQEGKGRDYDMPCAFPRALLEVDPAAATIREWVEDSAGVAERVGVDRALLKRFVSAAPGIGQIGILKWCESVADFKGIEHFELPDFCKRYRAEARKIKQRIMDSDPASVEVLKDTHPTNEAIANAMAYVHCCKWEASRINTMVQRLEGAAVIRSLECDGLYVTLMPGKTWEEVESIMASVHPMVHKPYTPVAELLEKMQLRFDTIPPSLWTTYDRAWKAKCDRTMELWRRLRAGESPTLVAADLVPKIMIEHGVLLKDKYKAAPGRQAGMSFFTFKEMDAGGLWIHLTGGKALDVELDVVRALCVVLGVSADRAPERFLKGGFSSEIVSRCANELYDAEFHGRLDGDKSFKYLGFADGRVVDLTTFEAKACTPEMFVHRHCSYAYPEASFAEIERALATAGIDIEELLGRINTWERTPTNAGAEQYSPGILADLDRLVQIPFSSAWA